MVKKSGLQPEDEKRIRKVLENIFVRKTGKKYVPNTQKINNFITKIDLLYQKNIELSSKIELYENKGEKDPELLQEIKIWGEEVNNNLAGLQKQISSFQHKMLEKMDDLKEDYAVNVTSATKAYKKLSKEEKEELDSKAWGELSEDDRKKIDVEKSESFHLDKVILDNLKNMTEQDNKMINVFENLNILSKDISKKCYKTIKKASKYF